MIMVNILRKIHMTIFLIQSFYPTSYYPPLSKSINYYDNWAFDCNYPDEFIVYGKKIFK